MSLGIHNGKQYALFDQFYDKYRFSILQKMLGGYAYTKDSTRGQCSQQ